MITSCYVLMNELSGENFTGKSASVRVDYYSKSNVLRVLVVKNPSPYNIRKYRPVVELIGMFRLLFMVTPIQGKLEGRSLGGLGVPLEAAR